MEKWEPVKNYEGLYIVSNEGNVKNFRTGRMLTQTIVARSSKSKYKIVSLCNNNKYQQHKVHRLVFFSFHHYAPTSCEIHHLNGNGLDNRFINLMGLHREEHQLADKKLGRSSKYVGVCWDKNKQKWIAQIRTGNKKIKYLGYHNCETAAMIAYQKTKITLQIAQAL